MEPWQPCCSRPHCRHLRRVMETPDSGISSFRVHGSGDSSGADLPGEGPQESVPTFSVYLWTGGKKCQSGADPIQKFCLIKDLVSGGGVRVPGPTWIHFYRNVILEPGVGDATCSVSFQVNFYQRLLRARFLLCIWTFVHSFGSWKKGTNWETRSSQCLRYSQKYSHHDGKGQF